MITWANELEKNLNRRMRGTALVLAVSATLAVGGCAIIPTEPERTPSALEACAEAHPWKLDMAALQEDVVKGFAEAKISVLETTVEGSQSLDWAKDGTIKITSNYTIIAKASSDVADVPYVVTQTVNGTATGRAYFNDKVAVPRDWNSDALKVTTTAVKGDEKLEKPPFAIPKTVVDDVVGLIVECSPTKMTMQPRGSHRLLTWEPGA